MKRWQYFALACAVFCLLGAPPGYPASLSLYDDFAGSQIDATKWVNLEVVQEIRDGRLAMKYRAASAPGFPSQDLAFANPTSIQSFQADVRLNEFSVPPEDSARMRLRGNFYNDGTVGQGVKGDVRAQLYLLGSAGGVNVFYHAYKCTNADCSTNDYVIPIRKVKSVALGEVHILGIAWNGSVFTFSVDGVDFVEDPSTVQPVVNSAPNVPGKVLSAQLSISRNPDNTVGGPGGTGFVAGDFDRVIVNGVEYDDFDGAPFSGPRLDPAKWIDLLIVREVAGGHLVSKVGWTGPAGNTTFAKNRSRFVNQNAVVAMKTDVTITDYLTTGAFAQVMLLGAFYNDGSSTGVLDSTGDIEGWLRIGSYNNNAPQLQLGVDRCNNAACDTQTMLFSDGFGTIDVGAPHTLILAWNGSVFTYGIDLDIRYFDPKPSIVKPPQSLTKDIRTWVTIQQNGGHGYIATTFDNIYVDDQAVTPPRLAPFLQESVRGDVTSAGVGLRGTGTGSINLTGIPAGATVQKAFLYWATLGTDGTFTSPTLNGVPVVGSLIGKSDDPLWGAAQSYAYRADVTPLVSGNGTYAVAGLPNLGPQENDSQGASLVVIYSLRGTPPRVITINDGAVTLSGSRVQSYSTTLGGFLATNLRDGARLTFLVADGQSWTPEYAGLNATLLATNEFSGNDENYWDTRTYDVSELIEPTSRSAEASISTANDALVWVAAILSVPAPPQVNIPLPPGRPPR